MADRYPLASLLDVRRYRERAAEQNVRAAEEAARQARELVLRKEEAFDAWRLWKTEEVERRYQRLIGKKLPIDKLYAFNEGLAALSAEEFRLAEALEALREEARRSSEKLLEAKSAVKRARQNTAKIETHRSIWLEEDKKELERAEEREFEEFKPMKPADASEDDFG